MPACNYLELSKKRKVGPKVFLMPKLRAAPLRHFLTARTADLATANRRHLSARRSHTNDATAATGVVATLRGTSTSAPSSAEGGS